MITNGTVDSSRFGRRWMSVIALALATCGMVSAASFTKPPSSRSIEKEQQGITGSVVGMADVGVGTLFILKIDRGEYGWQFLPKDDFRQEIAKITVELGRARSVLIPAWENDHPAIVVYYDSLNWHMLEEMQILPEAVLKMISPRGLPAGEVTREYRYQDVSQNAELLNMLLISRQSTPNRSLATPNHRNPSTARWCKNSTRIKRLQRVV